MININIEENKFWKKYTLENAIVFFKGYIYSYTLDVFLNKLEVLSREDLQVFLSSLNGHFALIVQKDTFSFMAVDKIRSTPLFFIKKENNFYIDNDPKNLVKNINFNQNVIDESILEILMSGYTIGNKTIYNDLFSLKAGELVIFEKNDFKYIQYYKYFGEIINKSYSEYMEELSEVTLNIFKKMLEEVGNRQIIIPLSAGNDSRLVASALKHLGAKNVKCYSYGSIGNFEASIAKVIASKLGYEWKFIPLTHKTENKFYASLEYKDYLKFAETYCSVPYIQSLSTIKYLKEMNWIDNDAVFINGNSGDFVSGAHINSLIKCCSEDMSLEDRKENILKSLIEKHFSLWGNLKTSENIKRIKNSLWNEITLACGNIDDKDKDHLFYEYSELIDRQSRYVISGQRAYEFYNHEWRLPLWDDEYLYFWQKIPAEYKVNQKLYVDMLKKKNYGNVWGMDIPVNKKDITPKWIIPIRFLAKIPFGLFGKAGKKAWKQFEINFFYYWMDVTHMMNTISYFRSIRDIYKKPRNQTSWWSEDYYKRYRKFK
ncbi:hypothetical protein [Sulfurimonas sp.]